MGVTINGVTLTAEARWALALQLGAQVPDGRYFYDHATGAWGLEGGAVAGHLLPNLPLPRPAPSPSAAAARADETVAGDANADVVINGVPIDAGRLTALTRQYGVTVRPGRYWYDALAGAWGFEGGHTVGLAVAGLELGGPLRADASGGRTGVFVNGRELHPLDVQALARLGPVLPGRYWLDAQGNGGVEGGPIMFNLAQLARQASGGGPWSKAVRNADGTSNHVGGDGNGFFYFSSKDTSLIIG